MNLAVFFDGSRLTLARQLAGFRKNELANIIEKSPAAVTSWETGRKRPTTATLAQLAITLSVSPKFFTTKTQDTTTKTSTPHFRSLRSTSQISRDQAYAYGQIALEIAETIELYVELPKDYLLIPIGPESLDNNNPEEY